MVVPKYMDLPKYAKLENERRFRVERPTDLDLEGLRSALIEDLYIDNTRLRLRKVTPASGEAISYKLCKKYPCTDPYSGTIVNTYLTAEEHAVFCKLPGRHIVKRRHYTTFESHSFGIDIFQGKLAGLILCEAEASTRQAVCDIQFPSWATIEVTEDPFFSGGNLSSLDRHELLRRLSGAR
ncbi:MAG: hypothetical protein AB8G77_09205 [Rhodothermales bacterium]